MAIQHLSISYPLFVLDTIIDPDEANQNNSDIVNKVNDVVDLLNTDDTTLALTKTVVDAHVANMNNPHGITAGQINTYTKEELNPYLRGGDTLIKVEVFTITNPNNGDGTFTYTDKDAFTHLGTISPEGYQVFALLNGSYQLNENRIEAIVNNSSILTPVDSGLVEIDTTHIALANPEVLNTEIIFKYFERVGIQGTGLVVVGANDPGTGYCWFKTL